MQSVMKRATSASFFLLFCATTVEAQSRFANSVVNFTQGTGGGTFVPANALGGPRGAGLTSGSLDVCSLGVGGSLTLGFEVVITDGPGADFTVFENPLLFNGQPFSEVAYVEVSSNGLDFARFPTKYAGPSTGFSGFTAPFGAHSGFTGFVPVVANVLTNSVDPLDPVVSGGEAFDLSALALDPLVVGGTVDLAHVNFVRIVDVPHQTGLDSFGHAIFDNSGATGTADIDAVAVLNHAGSTSPTQPIAELFFDAQGFLNLRLEAVGGLAALDFAQVHASFNMAPVPLSRLRVLVPLTTPTANGVLMRSSIPIQGSGLFGVLAISAKDFVGQACADQIVLQG